MSDVRKRAQAQSEDGCELQQLTTFDCDREFLEKKGIIKCYPVPRVFRVYGSISLLRVLCRLIHPEQLQEPSSHRSNKPFRVQGLVW